MSSALDTVGAMRHESWVDTRARSWRVRIPETRRERARGLLGGPEPAPGDALFLARCRSVHTFGMRFAIDALVLDANLAVIDVVTMPRRRVLLPRPRGRHVLEVAAGSRIRSGDRFQIRIVRSARLKT
jgi:uncharacterized protein